MCVVSFVSCSGGSFDSRFPCSKDTFFLFVALFSLLCLGIGRPWSVLRRTARAKAGTLQKLEVAQRQAHRHRGPLFRWDIVYNTPHLNVHIKLDKCHRPRSTRSCAHLSFEFVIVILESCLKALQMSCKRRTILSVRLGPAQLSIWADGCLRFKPS